MATSLPQVNKAPAPSSGKFTFSLETPSLSSGTLDKYLKQVLGEGSSTALPELLKQAAEAANAASAASTLSSTEPPKESPPMPTATETAKPISVSAVPAPVTVVPIVTPTASSPAAPVPVAVESTSQAVATTPANNASNQQLATTDSLLSGQGGEMIPIPRGQSYVDITDYLNMPQADAAKKLGIPPSTLSKRWKEAVRKRKWPYRMICKIDKEIMTLLHNVPQGPNAPPLPEEIETALGLLLRKRQEELRPVVIRI
jgi:hypothetical protein